MSPTPLCWVISDNPGSSTKLWWFVWLLQLCFRNDDTFLSLITYYFPVCKNNLIVCFYITQYLLQTYSQRDIRCAWKGGSNHSIIFLFAVTIDGIALKETHLYVVLCFEWSLELSSDQLFNISCNYTVKLHISRFTLLCIITRLLALCLLAVVHGYKCSVPQAAERC